MRQADMEPQQPQAGDAAPGLIAGLAALAKNLLGLFMSRIELAAFELAEVRTNVLKFMVVFALGVMTAWFAIVCWTILAVYLGWQSFGWKIVPLLAAGFTLLTFVIYLYARRMLAQGRLSMPATMAELRHDRDALL
jgi:uncharacterized membrane protein YqjE